MGYPNPDLGARNAIASGLVAVTENFQCSWKLYLKLETLYPYFQCKFGGAGFVLNPLHFPSLLHVENLHSQEQGMIKLKYLIIIHTFCLTLQTPQTTSGLRAIFTAKNTSIFFCTCYCLCLSFSVIVVSVLSGHMTIALILSTLIHVFS